MPIEPDAKDRTWVLARPSSECGFDSSAIAPESLADLVRSNAEEWRVVPSGDPAQLAVRPSGPVWSPLEWRVPGELSAAARDADVVVHHLYDVGQGSGRA